MIHTPGPWLYGRRTRNKIHINGANWDEFAKVVVRFSDLDHDDGVGLANAQLIIAAPDLLDALTGLIEAVRKDSDDDGKGISGYTAARLSDAKAAVAKATALPNHEQKSGGE